MLTKLNIADHGKLISRYDRSFSIAFNRKASFLFFCRLVFISNFLTAAQVPNFLQIRCPLLQCQLRNAFDVVRFS